VERHLAEIRDGNFSSHHANISTMDLIRDHHSYDQRVNTIPDCFRSTVFSPGNMLKYSFLKRSRSGPLLQLMS
jgi:hypothetical protein